MSPKKYEDRNHGGERKHKYYSSGGRADYSKLDGQRIIELIEIISESGGAIRLGKTRDGGAYAIGVYGDGDQPYTDYLKPGESVESYLSGVVDALTDLGTKKPPRRDAPKEVPDKGTQGKLPI